MKTVIASITTLFLFSQVQAKDFYSLLPYLGG